MDILPTSKLYFRQRRIWVSYSPAELMAIRKTSIEIDQDLLDQVRNALGTATLKETVEEAFLEVLRERARREEVEALSGMRGMDLDDDQVMAGAWRT